MSRFRINPFTVKRLLLVAVMSGGLLAAHGEEAPDPWAQFMPPPDDRYDWIQLDSGEWLKGELKALYNHKMEFDSDELDLQTFDFEDVNYIRTCRPFTLLVELPGSDRETKLNRGLLEIDGKRVLIGDGDFRVEMARRQIVAIAPDSKRIGDLWSGKVSVGATGRSGNSDKADANVSINLTRRSALSRLVLNYLANYSESNGVKTDDDQRVSGHFDWFLTTRFYWKILDAEYYRDTFANIEGQYSVSTGPGYELIWTSKTEWLVYAGLGYQQQRAVSAEAGADNETESPFLSLGTFYDVEVTKRIDFLADYSMRWLNEDNGTYTHHAVSTLSIEIINDFDVDLSFVWDRIETPRRSSDGLLPEQDDYQLIVGVGYKF